MNGLTDLSSLSKKIEIPDKSMGIWTIPDLDIEIPVYSWKNNMYNSQAIVDEVNSACYSPYCNAFIISDHAGSISTNGKGIWQMENVTLDMTAFFRKRDYTMSYTCYSLYRADWHTWGYTINGSMILPHSSKDILCASCVDSTGKQVYLAVFKEGRKL